MLTKPLNTNLTEALHNSPIVSDYRDGDPMEISQIKKLVCRFIDDTKGNFGVMAALTTLGILSGVGLSVDAQRFYSHSNKTQFVADTAGIAAALWATNLDGIPTESGPGHYVEGQKYSAAEFGIGTRIGEEITVSFDYDVVAREVTVITEGSITPLMLQLLGKEAISSSSSATIKFPETNQVNAASVLFVLDNSGSMLFDDIPLTIDIDDYSDLPSNEQSNLNFLTWNWLNSASAKWVAGFYSQEGATPRIDALKANMTRFNTQLTSLVAQSTSPVRFLRTGILTYNNNIVRESPLNWGALDQEQDIDRMSPISGTNSSVAFTKAVQDFADEDQQHLTENGSLDPTKYLVFMSDGQNTDSSNLTSWLPVPDVAPTGLFRIYRQARCTRFFFGRCIRATSAGYEEWDVDIHGVGTGASNPNEAGLSGVWEEGRYVSPGDAATIADCTTLKSQNVTIYTIGFALDSGTFDTNTWADLFNPYRSSNQLFDIEDDSLERAFSLLDACATSDNTFLLANDANDLSIAFQTIQARIAEDVVRLRE